jgi:hypothetical protein
MNVEVGLLQNNCEEEDNNLPANMSTWCHRVERERWFPGDSREPDESHQNDEFRLRLFQQCDERGLSHW